MIATPVFRHTHAVLDLPAYVMTADQVLITKT